MKPKSLIIPLLFLIVQLSNVQLLAQGQSFTLQQAIDYALKNNVSIQNAELDAEIAEAKKKETTGMGLPQLNGNFDAKEFWEIPTSVLPNFIAPLTGAPKGSYPEFVTAKFGVRYNLSAGLSASQLLFNSDYLIGLQAAKVYTDLAKKDIVRNRIDVIASVSKAYYRVMVNQQNIKLLDVNIERLKQLKDQTKAMYEAGFVEATDLDRIDLLHNNLITEKEKVNRLVMLSDALLKFQMGFEISKPIAIADSLDIKNLPATGIIDVSKTNISTRIEYQTIENAIKLQELDLKRNKFSMLPTVALYSALSANNLRNEFKEINWSNRWFPTGVIGITVNQPIFSGFQKKFKTDQVALNLQKTKNNLKQFEHAGNLEVQNTATMYNNNIQNLQIQQKNIELAEKIYKSSKAKYDQGSISGLDLFVSLTSLKEAQNNLYAAIYDVLNSKIDYDKALGNIK